MELVYNLTTDAVDDVDRELFPRVVNRAHCEEIRIKVFVDDVVADERSWQIVLMLDVGGSLVVRSDLMDGLRLSKPQRHLPDFPGLPILGDLVASKHTSLLVDACEVELLLLEVEVLRDIFTWISLHPWDFLVLRDRQHELALGLLEANEHELAELLVLLQVFGEVDVE